MYLIKLALLVVSTSIFLSCATTSNVNNAVVNTNAVQRTNTANLNAASPSPAVATAATGAEIYAKNCVNCHKESGTGGKVTIEGKTLNVENLTSQKLKDMTDDRMIRYVSEGVEDEGMPAFKDKLSEQEIRDVVRYIRTDLQKKQPAGETSLSQ